jgi:hypothetical protein
MYKNTSGKWLTKALFFELTGAHRPHACFTLKDDDYISQDGSEYKSLKKTFLSYDDPTEYEFAAKELGGWSHWKELQKVDVISVEIEEWREERDVRLRSQGVKQLIRLAEEDGSFQASKYLADKGWEEDKKRGRPSKHEVNKQVKQQAQVKSQVSADLERLRKLNG